jgi:hypothetical protein
MKTWPTLELIRIKIVADSGLSITFGQYQIMLNERIIPSRAWEYGIDSAGDGAMASPEAKENS